MNDYELDYLIGEKRGAINAWKLALNLTTVKDIRAALEAYVDEISDSVDAEIKRRETARADLARR